MFLNFYFKKSQKPFATAILTIFCHIFAHFSPKSKKQLQISEKRLTFAALFTKGTMLVQ